MHKQKPLKIVIVCPNSCEKCPSQFVCVTIMDWILASGKTPPKGMRQNVKEFLVKEATLRAEGHVKQYVT